MSDRPHICFVAPNAWPILSGDATLNFAGGAEVQQCQIARALARNGYNVTMITGDFGQAERAEIDGVRAVKCRFTIGKVPVVRFFHPRLTALWSALTAVDADIYYQRCAGPETGIVALFARVHNRRFIYAAAHDLDLARADTWKLFQRRAGRRDRCLYTFGLKRADAIVVQHLKQRDDCFRWYGREATVVPSCYDMRSTACSQRQGFVLWVSILRSWKRPEVFLELAKRLPNVPFRMIGGPSTDPGGPELFEKMQRLSRDIPNLEFAGFVPYSRIEQHFDGARLFVNTSEHEGFPNTFLQSWARGIPTISFVNTGSVIGGRPVVNVVRDIDEMVGCVGDLMRDDSKWEAAGALALSCYRAHHSIQSATAAYERLFAQLAGSPAVARHRPRRRHIANGHSAS
jgi:glycosyltransferase involved in cell wall biosynthesis